MLDALEGQLTATLHAEPDELDGLRGIVTLLERRSGRVIFNGFPTGVAVTRAMQHGGPYPATTAPGHTSVGTHRDPALPAPGHLAERTRRAAPGGAAGRQPAQASGAWSTDGRPGTPCDAQAALDRGRHLARLGRRAALGRVSAGLPGPTTSPRIHLFSDSLDRMQTGTASGDGISTASGAFARYVAIGDSTTEGLEDPTSDGVAYVGFADRLAARLARDQPGLLYANLGIRGRKMHRIHEEQHEPALALEPDLVSIVGGINDILRPRCDLVAVADHLEQMVAAFSERGATVLGMTFPDAARIMPAARPARGRILAFNAQVRSIAARHQMRLADLERHGVVDERLWSVDRLHANSAGHARIAAAMTRRSGSSPTRIPGRHFRPPAGSRAPSRCGARRCGSAAMWLRG